MTDVLPGPVSAEVSRRMDEQGYDRGGPMGARTDLDDMTPEEVAAWAAQEGVVSLEGARA